MNASAINVLIVEDDEFQRNIASRIFQSIGVASISLAGNGKEALSIIHDEPPIHVALCDLSMPEMDGMEFLRHLGEGGHKISVILTSALDSKLLSSVARMSKLYGIKLLGTIGKPMQLSSLEALLAKFDGTSPAVQCIDDRKFSLDEILQAVEDDQFEPFFQAKVDLKTGRLVGAEALARWIHPEYGVIGPGAFIPILEETRNIDRLTFQILEKTAAACHILHEQGRILSISVNLSLTSLDDTSLADQITELVRKSGIEPQYLILEITESAAMTNIATALENLTRLCMNGFSLSIDDYGTGSSNLQQLTRIPFNELKIDQSFVKDFTENAALMVIVKSSVEMAHKLNVKSVAEGVETRHDYETLKGTGCDIAQGYFISKPIDIHAFSEFAANYRLEPSPDSPAAASTPKKAKILVVDDDNFARKIILHVLRDLGHKTVTDVSSAESAIKLFDSNSFDLVITDVNMPGINGLKFIQMIRSGKTRAKPETRIMVLTLFSQTDVLSTTLAMDVNGFLVKPIIPSVLEEKLACAMSERLHLRPTIAYESVITDAKSLPYVSSEIHPNVNASVVLEKKKAQQQNWRKRSISLNKLRPGMILAENVHLNDGMLILSAGQALSEVSINRLMDLKEILSVEDIPIQENLSAQTS